ISGKLRRIAATGGWGNDSQTEEQEMKPIWNASVACLFACGWLSAAPPTCVTAALADYIALGAQGCTLNGDAYANFSYSAGASGGAATVTPGLLDRTPPDAIALNPHVALFAPRCCHHK